MFVFGVNHKTAPIEIREKFFLNPLQQDLLISALKTDVRVAECFVLSTCNRIEVYIKRIDTTFNADIVLQLIAKIKKISFDQDISSYTYSYEKQDALLHLLRVTCGLDSLVLGERQILGQVKVAVERSRELGGLSKYFNILTNIAIRAGKKAHFETSISQGGSSISWAAIEMAEQTVGVLKDKHVLVIGAGKMGELALSQLKNKGIEKIYLMNRTGEKAQQLADEHGCMPASFMDIKEILTDVDICFCSVGAPHYILGLDMLTKIMELRNQRQILLIDISMPRNIDPAVSKLKGVHLMSIDDLEHVVRLNMEKRQQAMVDVEEIINKKMLEFTDKWNKISSAANSDFYQAV